MASPRPYLARTPVALAHRGGALYAPNLGLENTLTAFGNAVALGYTHLETDVHVTRDGRLVAFHDTRLDRVSDIAGRIRDLPWDEVRRAAVGPGPEHDHVPLLAEVSRPSRTSTSTSTSRRPAPPSPLWAPHRGARPARPGLRRLVLAAPHLAVPPALAWTRCDRGRRRQARPCCASPPWLTALLRTPAEVLPGAPVDPCVGRRRLC